jgi:hypothetical protein
VVQFDGEVEAAPSHLGLFRAKGASTGEMETITFIGEKKYFEFTPRILFTDD